MIVNPDKFQAIVIKKNCRMKDSYALNINNETINSKNCIKLLGIEIDNTLSFNKHISTLFISGIPCQSRLKKKPTTISLKIILINGLVQNINAIYVLI